MIQFLVERLEALVVNARKVPMTSNVILEQAALLDLIDRSFRRRDPEAVKQARRISQDSERVVARARARRPSRIIAAAQEQAAVLLQDHAILREAETQGPCSTRAQTKAEEIMRGADQYAADVLDAPRATS